METKKIEVILSEKVIAKRVRELAKQIDKDYKNGDLVVIGVLKGAFIFMSDLVRNVKRKLSCDFLRVSSYDTNDRDTGVVRMEFDMTQPVGGKHVLLVEDIVETGKTLVHLRRHIETKEPASLKVMSFLYKGVTPEVRGLVDYIGFESPHKFIIGYGLDSQGNYRSLPYIGAFK